MTRKSNIRKECDEQKMMKWVLRKNRKSILIECRCTSLYLLLEIENRMKEDSQEDIVEDGTTFNLTTESVSLYLKKRKSKLKLTIRYYELRIVQNKLNNFPVTCEIYLSFWHKYYLCYSKKVPCPVRNHGTWPILLISVGMNIMIFSRFPSSSPYFQI